MSKFVLDSMNQQIEQWEAEKDNRRYFLQCYRLMTRKMLKAIQQQEFIDNKWIKRLLEHFAEYYFKALKKYEEKALSPCIWTEVFDRTNQSELPVLQAMILGVNAHINYDLIFCLKDMLVDEWENLSKDQKEKRYKDHRKVNEIIASTIDQVQDEIIEPNNYVMEVIDSIFGRLDEYLLSRLIISWREEVWEMAIQLIECEEEEKRAIYDQIEKKAIRKMAILKISF